MLAVLGVHEVSDSLSSRRSSAWCIATEQDASQHMANRQGERDPQGMS